MFKTENSLARTKLQEPVTVRRADPNRSRTERWSAQMANPKAALQIFNPNFIKEFSLISERMPNLSGTTIEYKLCPYVYNFKKFIDIIFINSK